MGRTQATAMMQPPQVGSVMHLAMSAPPGISQTTFPTSFASSQWTVAHGDSGTTVFTKTGSTRQARGVVSALSSPYQTHAANYVYWTEATDIFNHFGLKLNPTTRPHALLSLQEPKVDLMRHTGMNPRSLRARATLTALVGTVALGGCATTIGADGRTLTTVVPVGGCQQGKLSGTETDTTVSLALTLTTVEKTGRPARRTSHSTR